MRLHRSAHAVYKTQDPVGWVTRSRRTILVPGVPRYLHGTLYEVCKWRPEWEGIAIGMEVDHGPLHRGIPPRYAVSHVWGMC